MRIHHALATLVPDRSRAAVGPPGRDLPWSLARAPAMLGACRELLARRGSQGDGPGRLGRKPHSDR